MKTWQSTLLGCFLGLIASSVILLIARSPRGESITLIPQPTLGPIVVYVVGEVANPGNYTLPRQSRVQEAITAAGGFLPAADPTSLNLAGFLSDGQKVLVSPIQPTPDLSSAAAARKIAQSTATIPAPTSDSPLDLNTATQAELELLPGIGPTRAQDILRYREEHNGFKKIEEIQNVPGIGPETYKKIKSLIAVAG